MIRGSLERCEGPFVIRAFAQTVVEAFKAYSMSEHGWDEKVVLEEEWETAANVNREVWVLKVILGLAIYFLEMEMVESECCLGIGEESSRGIKYRRTEILKLILRMVYETE